jgi:hypothetical protein
MRMSWHAAGILTVLAIAPGAASAAASVEASLRTMPSANADEDPTVVVLELKNIGDKAASLRSRSLPDINREGRLMQDVFVVLGADGTTAPYAAIIVEYDDNAPEPYIVLAPQQVQRVTVSLARSYRLRPGIAYEVKLRSAVRYLDIPVSEYLARDNASLRAVEQAVQVESTIVDAPAE